MKWEADTEEVLVQCVPVARCEFPIAAPWSRDQEEDCYAPAVATIVWETGGRATEMDVCKKHEDKIRADYFEMRKCSCTQTHDPHEKCPLHGDEAANEQWHKCPVCDGTITHCRWCHAGAMRGFVYQAGKWRTAKN